MNHAHAHPVRLRVHEPSLHCDVRRVIGYRADCPCGWRGPWRGVLAAAREDARAHNKQHRTPA